MSPDEVLGEFFHLASLTDLQNAFSALVHHHNAIAWVAGLVQQRRERAAHPQLLQRVSEPTPPSIPGVYREHEAELVKQARGKLQGIARAKYSPHSTKCIRPLDALLDLAGSLSKSGLPFVALQILSSIALAWPKLHEDLGVDDSCGDADIMQVFPSCPEGEDELTTPRRYISINSAFDEVLAKVLEVGVDKTRKAVVSKACTDYGKMVATWCRYGGRQDRASALGLFDEALASVGVARTTIKRSYVAEDEAAVKRIKIADHLSPSPRHYQQQADLLPPHHLAPLHPFPPRQMSSLPLSSQQYPLHPHPHSHFQPPPAPHWTAPPLPQGASSAPAHREQFARDEKMALEEHAVQKQAEQYHYLASRKRWDEYGRN